MSDRATSERVPTEKVTVPSLGARKRRDGAQPIVMVTAYDAPGARIADRAGVDAVLVGDSVATAVLGHEDTLSVTVDEMAHHVAAVGRARPRPLVVGDLPWMSYHLGTADTLRNASRLVRAGAQAVKLEGGRRRVEVVEALVGSEIPVMGHLGLTPQSVHHMGGFRVQAREVDAARELLADAETLESAGCFALVLEGVPDVVAGMVTEHLEIPTIGIGAGQWCDGQVMVLHDLLGLEDTMRPKFVRRYAELADDAVAAVARWADDVRKGRYPTDDESYHARDDVAASLIRSSWASPPSGAGVS